MQMNGMLEICSVGRNSEPHSPRATYRGHLIYLLRRRRGSPLCRTTTSNADPVDCSGTATDSGTNEDAVEIRDDVDILDDGRDERAGTFDDIGTRGEVRRAAAEKVFSFK